MTISVTTLPINTWAQQQPALPEALQGNSAKSWWHSLVSFTTGEGSSGVTDPCTGAIMGSDHFFSSYSGILNKNKNCISFSMATAAVSSQNNQFRHETKEAFLKLWREDMIGFNQTSHVAYVKDILNQGAKLAAEKITQRREKWCETGKKCEPHFEDIYISQVAGSRLLVKPVLNNLKGSMVWEISANLIFPIFKDDEIIKQAKIERVAAELIKLTADVSPKMGADLRRKYQWAKASTDSLKIKIIYKELGFAENTKFAESLRAGESAAKSEEFNPASKDHPLDVFSHLDFSGDTLDVRLLPVPEYTYEDQTESSNAELQKTNQCTVEQATNRFDEGELDRLLEDAKTKAQSYLKQFTTASHIAWCADDGDPNCLRDSTSFKIFPNAVTVLNHQADGAWRFELPSKMFCHYKSALRPQFVEYLALEIIRAVPGFSPSLNRRAAEMQVDQGLTCSDGANTLLGWNIVGWHPEIPALSTDLRNTLSTMCNHRPLRPPGYEIPSRDASQAPVYETVAQGPYKKYPLWVSCGPENIQELFLAKLPPCFSINLAMAKKAISGVAGNLDTGGGEDGYYRYTHQNIDILASILFTVGTWKFWTMSKFATNPPKFGKILDAKEEKLVLEKWEAAGLKFSRQELAILTKEDISRTALLAAQRTPKGGTPLAFGASMLAGIIAGIYLNPQFGDSDAQPRHLVSTQLIDKLEGGDYLARQALFTKLFNWTEETAGIPQALDQKAREERQNAAFKRILTLLYNDRNGREVLVKIKDM